MSSKLTLHINAETIKRARQIAVNKGISISKMVEEYLNEVIKNEEIRESSIDQIHGILKGKIINSSLDWKRVKEEAVIDKYTV